MRQFFLQIIGIMQEVSPLSLFDFFHRLVFSLFVAHRKNSRLLVEVDGVHHDEDLLVLVGKPACLELENIYVGQYLFCPEQLNK